MAESTRRLLVRGIASAKAGDVDQARHYLEWVLRTENTHAQREDAWFWLSQISEETAEKREYLESVLAANPRHQRAQLSIAVLDGKLAQNAIIDPDHHIHPVRSGEVQETTADRFECPNCGSRMVFTPDGQSLTCEYCRSREDEQESIGELAEQSFLLSMATARGHNKAVMMRTFDCDGCGAKFVLTPETISATCPHCESTYAADKTDEAEYIPPEGIIPFQFDRDRTVEILKQWLRQQKVKGRGRIKSVQGIYLPVWTFDIGGLLNWKGHTYSGSSHNTLAVSGDKPVFYDDILVPASNPQPPHFDDLLPGYNLKEVIAYDSKYIANWLAETYQIKLSNAALFARQKALALGRRMVKNSMSGSVQDLTVLSTDIHVESFKLVLLPIWVCHYEIEGLTYETLVNGQTEDVIGETPETRFEKFVDWLLD
ncbi:MAG: tetratricopeptide repeat protein [Chloroflexi bacterium]|nr:MAG: tetratricopeptide repeat protein [Chloroflexota bacterium]MBL1196030.1 tetratricopeptide repeat protein [Chloroflexota bacterium]NOH13324.1 tetratricopeptide repeat protein [Chloroflexota bacterium]